MPFSIAQAAILFAEVLRSLNRRAIVKGSIVGNEKYKVIQLFAPDDPLPRYVEPCRIDRVAPWRTIWRHREELHSKLASWCRELAARGQEPVERCLLGRSASLDEPCARAVARFRVEQIARMSRTWPDYPDFLMMDRPTNVGRHGVPVWADGVMYPSRAAAARAAGITRRAVFDRMRHDGWRWV